MTNARATVVPAPVSLVGLATLMVRSRARRLINGLWRSNTARSPRLFALLGVMIPAAYLGLFITSFDVVAHRAEAPVQVATLAVVIGGLVFSSLTSKIVAAEAVSAGSSENEFFLVLPISLARLAVARSLAAAALDFWGALFLFPVLMGAAVVWHLGWAGALVAAAVSIITQVGVVSTAQSIQIALARIVPRRRRQLLSTLLSLTSALSIATLWLMATYVLRRPDRFIEIIEPYANAVGTSPLGWFPAGLRALADKNVRHLAIALGTLAAASTAGVVVVALVARWAARDGWEDVGEPWSEQVPKPIVRTGNGGALSVAGKDLRLLFRDRARLTTLLAMPMIFVGIQIFGAVGLDLSRDQPERLGVLAYSLCAYLAVLGPLAHMQAERSAFWLLRAVPVPLSRIMMSKALAWSIFVAGMAVVAYLGLGLVAWGWGVLSLASLRVLCLVILGAMLASALAVAMGCNAADLTRTGKSAVGISTVYVFLIVAGLFNIVLVDSGPTLVRGGALFLAAVAAYWPSGMQRAADSLDPEAVATRTITPGEGLVASILLFLGVRATEMGAVASGMRGEGVSDAAALWATLVGAVVALQLLARWWRAAGDRKAVLRGLFVGVGLALVAAASLGFGDLRVAPLSTMMGVTIAEEFVFRGSVQGALQAQLGRKPLAVFVAVALTTLVALLATTMPLSLASVAIHLAATCARSLGGSVWSSLLPRILFP